MLYQAKEKLPMYKFVFEINVDGKVSYEHVQQVNKQEARADILDKYGEDLVWMKVVDAQDVDIIDETLSEMDEFCA